MKIIIGSDHAGFKLKEQIKELLKDTEDLGTDSKESVDYPLIAEKVAKKVAKTNSKGILICGTGIGMCISANKIKGIRAALCYDELTTKLARKHNNANILCIGARTDSAKNYKNIVKTFLTTEFSKEKRHHQRVKEMDEL